jgi:heptose-I-phosphate ethanolaminephosphotransferase
MDYRYRYPADYEHFKDNAGVPAALSPDKVQTYNFYDNAVRYNDYVVSSLIKRYAATTPNGFAVPLRPWRGCLQLRPARSPGAQRRRPTWLMATILFLLWTSPSWQASHPRGPAGNGLAPTAART